MRLWTIHPRYLDRQGLVALWREGLLAQAVLRGRTAGYRHHPQLRRFRDQKYPAAAIATYLAEVYREARRRGYHFDGTKIQRRRVKKQIPETQGQLLYEWRHLKAKLKQRSPASWTKVVRVDKPMPHALFRIVPGRVRNWEKRKLEPAPPPQR